MTAYQVYEIPIHPTSGQEAKLERHTALATDAYNIAAHAPHTGLGAVVNDFKRHLIDIQCRRPDIAEELPLAALETVVRNARNAVCSRYRNGESDELPTARPDHYRIAQKSDRRTVARFRKTWFRGVPVLRACLHKVGQVPCDLPAGFDIRTPLTSIEIRKTHGQWSLIAHVEVKSPVPEVIPTGQLRSKRGFYAIEPIRLSANHCAE